VTFTPPTSTDSATTRCCRAVHPIAAMEVSLTAGELAALDPLGDAVVGDRYRPGPLGSLPVSADTGRRRPQLSSCATAWAKNSRSTPRPVDDSNRRSVSVAGSVHTASNGP